MGTVAGTAQAADAVALAAVVWFAVGGVVLSIFDIRTHRLPNRWLMALFVGVLVPLTAATVITGDGSALLRGLAAAVLLFAGYLVLGWVSAGQIGFGDVKLAAIVGLLTGWFGWDRLLIATVTTFVLAGLVALALVAIRRASLQQRIAFGPFMVFGALLAVAVPAAHAVTGW